MSDRSVALQNLVDGLKASIFQLSDPDSPAIATAQKIFQALETRPGKNCEPAITRLSVCEQLNVALERSRDPLLPDAVHKVADAFKSLESELSWYRRDDSERIGPPFEEGHGNAHIIGDGGLEERNDVWIGVTLIAPAIEYPRHRHPPEEVYVVLSRGEWFREGEGWFEPGAGGIVYNPPGIIHAMRSSETPLLAFWLLWFGASELAT